MQIRLPFASGRAIPAWAKVAVILLVVVGAAFGATAETTKHFDLPAGVAERRLKQFSEQAEREVLFPTGMVQAVTTNAVRGDYRPREALDQLLAGTELVAVQDAQTGAFAVKRKTVTREKPASPLRRSDEKAESNANRATAADVAEGLKLSPFEVSAKADRGYGSAQAAGATRIALPVSDVAGSVVTVNQEVIQDTAGTMIGDVAKYVSGITASNDTGQGSVVVRGTYSRGGSLIEDGLPSSGIANSSAGVALIDMNAYDRIEVIKGPNGILYGAHALGGLLNRVTKKPLPVPQTSVTVWGGSYRTWGGSLDSTGPVGDSKQLLYRIIVTGQKGEGPNGEDNNLRAITPQLEYRPTSDRTLRVAFSNVFGRVPRTTTTYVDPSGKPHFLWDDSLSQQVPGQAFREANFNEGTLTYNQTFTALGERWNLNLVGRYTDSETHWLLDQTMGAITALDAAGNSLGLLSQLPVGSPIASVRTANWFRRLFIGHDRRWIGNVDVTGTLPIGPTEHVLFSGVQVTGGNEDDFRYSFTPDAPTNGYEMWPHPTFPSLPSAAELAVASRRITPSTVNHDHSLLGWTLQDNMRMFDGRLIATAGVRWDKGGGSTTRQLAGPVTRSPAFDIWTPKYGLIAKPWPGTSLFFNKTQTYEIAQQIDVRLASPTLGQRFPNREGKTNEVGVKFELWDGRLIATAAHFDIRLTNGLIGLMDDDAGSITGLPRGAYASLGGELTTKGNEIDVAAVFGGGLQGIFGWSDLTALSESGSPIGAGVPSQTFSGLLRYALPSAWIEGLSLGAGVNRVEGRVMSSGDPRPIPDYTLAEAFATYRRERWELQVNMKNLTNKNYIISPNSLLGWPRTYSVRLRYSF